MNVNGKKSQKCVSHSVHIWYCIKLRGKIYISNKVFSHIREYMGLIYAPFNIFLIVQTIRVYVYLMETRQMWKDAF